MHTRLRIQYSMIMLEIFFYCMAVGWVLQEVDAFQAAEDHFAVVPLEIYGENTVYTLSEACWKQRPNFRDETPGNPDGLIAYTDGSGDTYQYRMLLLPNVTSYAGKNQSICQIECDKPSGTELIGTVTYYHCVGFVTDLAMSYYWRTVSCYVIRALSPDAPAEIPPTAFDNGPMCAIHSPDTEGLMTYRKTFSFQCVSICGAPVTNCNALVSICNENDVCVDIASCDAINSCSNWTRRPALEKELASLPLSDADFASPQFNTSINFYHIAKIEVPPGIRVHLCEPDFTQYDQQICFEKSVQTLDCHGPSRCVLESPSQRYQLFKLETIKDWSCNAQNELQYELTCPENEVVYDNNCVHKCQFIEPFAISNEVHDWNELTTTCSDFQHHMPISPACAAVTQPLYKCVDCPALNGSSTVPYADRVHRSQCEYTPCVPGTYSRQSHVCKQCAVHFISASQWLECEECPLGQISNHDHSQCIPCFVENAVSLVDSKCREGSRWSLEIDDVMDYYDAISILTETQTRTIIKDMCAQKYGCMPCPPGQFFKEQTCELCAVGSFQPNYGRTSCFECHNTETTLQTGSITNDACVCVTGHEFK